jgi:hypothetical protein
MRTSGTVMRWPSSTGSCTAPRVSIGHRVADELRPQLAPRTSGRTVAMTLCFISFPRSCRGLVPATTPSFNEGHADAA